MVAAGEVDDERVAGRQYRKIRLFVLVSLYKHSRLVARLSKYEITLCIGN